MSKYNTNLAAEFYVLAALHRLGVEAYLTLANKKGCDITVIREDQSAVRVEVKGVAGKHDWTINNVGAGTAPNTLLVLLSFEGAIDDLSQRPSLWILPLAHVADFRKEYADGGRVNIPRAAMLSQGQKYRDAWHYIAGCTSDPQHSASDGIVLAG